MASRYITHVGNDIEQAQRDLKATAYAMRLNREARGEEGGAKRRKMARGMIYHARQIDLLSQEYDIIFLNGFFGINIDAENPCATARMLLTASELRYAYEKEFDYHLYRTGDNEAMLRCIAEINNCEVIENACVNILRKR